MGRTIEDLMRDEQFTIFGTGSGRTTPNIGENASKYGLPGAQDPLGMGQQYSPGAALPYQNMGGESLAGMSGLSTGLMGQSSAPMFERNNPSGFGGEDDSDGMSGWEKAALATNIVGALGGIYGQYKEGRARDEELQRQREDYERRLREREASAKKLSPLLAALIGRKGSTLMES